MPEITQVSAVTLKVSDMQRSFVFYNDVLGRNLQYLNRSASFASFRAGNSHLNLERSDTVETGWGRIILYCDDVDEFYIGLKQKGLDPPKPVDGS